MFKLHPGKLTWKKKYGGLEDDFPFQIGDFVGSILIFQDVITSHLKNIHFQKRERIQVHIPPA